MASEVDLLLEYAKRKKMPCGTPATEDEIAAFEERYGVRLPADVREYFLRVNGVDEDNFIGLNSLESWTPFPASDQTNYYHINPPQRYFRIGNYDISVWEWYILLNPDPMQATPVIVTFHKWAKVADTFSEFLHLFCKDKLTALTEGSS